MIIAPMIKNHSNEVIFVSGSSGFCSGSLESLDALDLSFELDIVGCAGGVAGGLFVPDVCRLLVCAGRVMTRLLTFNVKRVTL